MHWDDQTVGSIRLFGASFLHWAGAIYQRWFEGENDVAWLIHHNGWGAQVGDADPSVYSMSANSRTYEVGDGRLANYDSPPYVSPLVFPIFLSPPTYIPHRNRSGGERPLSLDEKEPKMNKTS